MAIFILQEKTPYRFGVNWMC